MNRPENSGSACEQVIRDVWTFLDNEMDPEQRGRVVEHLLECPPCLDETDVGEKLKALLHRKCGGDVAPEVLRERLITALNAEKTAYRV